MQRRVHAVRSWFRPFSSPLSFRSSLAVAAYASHTASVINGGSTIPEKRKIMQALCVECDAAEEFTDDYQVKCVVQQAGYTFWALEVIHHKVLVFGPLVIEIKNPAVASNLRTLRASVCAAFGPISGHCSVIRPGVSGHYSVPWRGRSTRLEWREMQLCQPLAPPPAPSITFSRHGIHQSQNAQARLDERLDRVLGVPVLVMLSFLGVPGTEGVQRMAVWSPGRSHRHVPQEKPVLGHPTRSSGGRVSCKVHSLPINVELNDELSDAHSDADSVRKNAVCKLASAWDVAWQI
jgi:hypothetical protein